MVKIHKIVKTYKIYNYKNILIYNKFIIWDYFCLPSNIYMVFIWAFLHSFFPPFAWLLLLFWTY